MVGKNKAFIDLDPALRKILAGYFRECRGRDRHSRGVNINWTDQNRSLREYCHHLGIIPPHLTTDMDLIISEQGKICVLDIGMGNGEFLEELGRLYQKKLDATGVRLTYKPFPNQNHLTLRVGPAETLELPRDHFDFVFSVRGGVVYSINSFKTAETLLNALKLHGRAFIEDSKLLFTQDWFKEFLIKNGFEVTATRYQEGRPVAHKIKKQKSINLDLGFFSRRYTRLLNENKQIFLTWGFDRLNKTSPLDQIFSELYSAPHYEDLLG